MKRHFKAINVSKTSHRLQSFGHAFCIAVLASGTDLRASRHRIPSYFRPFNWRLRGHRLFIVFSRLAFQFNGRRFPILSEPPLEYVWVYLYQADAIKDFRKKRIIVLHEEPKNTKENRFWPFGAFIIISQECMH